MKKKGLFIVLDGTDGSGKATQTKLLAKKLRREGYKVEKIDFPQYGRKSAALVEEYLNGGTVRRKELALSGHQYFTLVTDMPRVQR